jgi:hypothetical protein
MLTNDMEKLANLLLEYPGLAREVVVPCCLWGLIEREDDEALRIDRSPELSIKLAQSRQRFS